MDSVFCKWKKIKERWKMKKVKDPFTKGCMGSQAFRIPSMLVTHGGTLVAACDVRWEHGKDSAGNLETVVARSVDGGECWERRFVNHFEDVVDGTDRCIFSAGFIDPALAEDSAGNLYMLVDLCPAFVGARAVNGMVCGQQNGGRHPNGRMALKDIESYTCAETQELTAQTYPYYVGEANESGYYPVLRLCDNTSYKAYLLDEEWYLYQRGEAGIEPVMIPQLDGYGDKTSKQIHANVFFAASPIKAYPAFHIVCRVSRDEGRTWSRMRDVSAQIGGVGFTAICPGRGYAYMYQGRERMVFPIYDNNLGTEFASVIYTEDGGTTWRRGQRADQTGYTSEGGYVKSSESQVVGLPDGRLRMYSRNMIREVTYADSFDGGETWGAYQRDPMLYYCGNCMVSVINYSRLVQGKAVLLASYPRGDDELYRRVNGVIAVGLVQETGEVQWKYHYQVNQEDFHYSCLAELTDGSIALWYEYEEAAMRYAVYSMDEVCKEILSGQSTPAKNF